MTLSQCLFRGNLNKHEGGGGGWGREVELVITLEINKIPMLYTYINNFFPFEFQSSMVVLVSPKKETV